MKIQTLVLGPLETNCYLLVDELSDQCLIIDPAASAETISTEIVSQNLEPVGMIATHGHYDHNMAAYELQLNFDLPLILHRADEFLVDEIAKRAAHWGHRIPALKAPDKKQFVAENEEIKCGNFVLKVLHTPGHTPGGLCLFNEQEQIVFTGDTLFADGVGRTDLSYSSSLDLKKSIKKIQAQLEGYQGRPGHGRQFIVSESDV